MWKLVKRPDNVTFEIDEKILKSLNEMKIELTDIRIMLKLMEENLVWILLVIAICACFLGNAYLRL